MPSKPSRTRNSRVFLRSPFLASLTLASVLSGAVAVAQSSAPVVAESGFFGGRDLDFWREGRRVLPFVPRLVASPTPVPTAQAQPSGSVIRQRDALAFDWSRYDDPANPEFWDDGGDYIAPRPLREAMARPTDENLARYLEWQAKRLQMVATFDAKLAQQGGAANHAQATPISASTEVVARVPDVLWRELELIYFYQSSCPHCRAEKEHVEELARRGVRITFVQLDAGEEAPLHARSVAYTATHSKQFAITATHSKQFAITATPTWIFRRREQSIRLEGEQSDAGLVANLSPLFSVSRDPSFARGR